MTARIIFLIFLAVSFAGDWIFKNSIAPQMNGFQARPFKIVNEIIPVAKANYILKGVTGPIEPKWLTFLIRALIIGFSGIILWDLIEFGKWQLRYSWHCAIMDGLCFGIILGWGYDLVIRGLNVANFQLILGGELIFNFSNAMISLIVMWAYLPVKPSTRKIEQRRKEKMKDGTS